MTPMVICYVPGSGGAKLTQLIANNVSVEDFKPGSHCHAPSKGNPNLFSLNHDINRSIRNKKFLVTEIQGDSDESIVFLLTDQENNLVDSNQKPIGYYCSAKRFAMTHCMKDQVVSQRYPNRFKIKILCDVRLALRRWWKVYAKNENLQIPHIPVQYQKILDKFPQDEQKLIAGLIIVHLDYYHAFYDVDADYVIDIHRNDDEFSEFMRKDLDICHDDVFDHVWESIMTNSALNSIWRSISDKIA